MAWKWGRARRDERAGEDREAAVMAELAVQQDAMNELSVAAFLAGVDGHRRGASVSPRESMQRRRDAVRRHRVESLAATGVVDSEAAALLVDDELAAGDALLVDGDVWGRWPEQCAITQAAEQTRAAAAQLPEAALVAVKVNVALVPSEEGR